MIGTAISNDGALIRFEHSGIGKPPLVLVHGWCCNRSYWRAQFDHFSQIHQVVAIDLGGHGDSGFDRRDMTIGAFGEDVCAVLKVLDLTDAVLIGHSLGAIVIVEAYRLLATHVKGLIAVEFYENADFQMSEEEIVVHTKPLRTNFRRGVEDLVRSYFPPTADAGLVDRVATGMASTMPEIAISTLVNARRYSKGQGLSSVKVPMRLINADFWPTDLVAARKYKPDIQLSVLPGLGHFVMLEDPGTFNHELRVAVLKLT